MARKAGSFWVRYMEFRGISISEEKKPMAKFKTFPCVNNSTIGLNMYHSVLSHAVDEFVLIKAYFVAIRSSELRR